MCCHGNHPGCYLPDGLNLCTKLTRKRYSEKPIVEFTNSIEILSGLLYNIMTVWSHVLALSAWTLKKAHYIAKKLSLD